MHYFLRMRYCFLFLLVFAVGIFKISGQDKFNLLNAESDKIKFELIDNLIILPVSVNGIELSFLLDTGVSRPIVFNILNFADSLQLKNLDTMSIRGLGANGKVLSIKSKNNVVSIGKALNPTQDIFIVFDNSINFTPILGVPVHGIIGYDLFKDFVVEINYRRKFIKLHNPQTYRYKKCRNCETLHLNFNNNKPYLNAKVVSNNRLIPVKLLIDSGGSDDLWLFEDDSLGIQPLNNKFFNDYLGRGLSGNVYGKRSKIAKLVINSFSFKNVNAAFPDSLSINVARSYKERSGSIAGGLLRRFNIIVDYPAGKLTLKKNANYRLPFSYNKSGIIVEQRGFRVVRELIDADIKDIYGRNNESSVTVTPSLTYGYNFKPSFEIVVVRSNSEAENAGIEVGDVILSINGKSTQNLSLQQVNKMFHLIAGSTIKMNIKRNNKELKFQFKLVDVFQRSD